MAIKYSDDIDKRTLKTIINHLRMATLVMDARKETLRACAKRRREGKTKKGETKWKFYWHCKKCDRWYRDQKSMEVDHIVELGTPPNTFTGLVKYMRRMFDRKNLQALCVTCHRAKTNSNASIRTDKKRSRQ